VILFGRPRPLLPGKGARARAGLGLRRSYLSPLAIFVALAFAFGTARADEPTRGPSEVPAEAPAEAPPAEIRVEAQPPPATSTATSTSNLSGSVTGRFASYADSDHVYVFTPSIEGSVSSPTAGWSVEGEYLVDVVSAASVDIVSTASRRWEEVRNAGDLSAAYKPGTLGVGANAAVSSEPDYLSLSAGGSVTQDLFDKNLSWLFAYDYAHDVAGRTGTPFSIFSRTIDRNAFKGGLTLVLDRTTLAALVGDVVLEDGDQSKPYRYVPLFAPGTNVPKGASAALVSSLRVSERPLEQLPLSRQRYALSARLAHRFRASTLRLDQRLYIDSWGLKATSTDARYLFDFGRVEIGPHLRFHAQTPVDFWQRAYILEPGYVYPAFRTGDRELGPLINATLGGTLEIGIGPASDPRAWVLGFDVNATSTQYLDDLYITQRTSVLGGVSLGAEL
jgi:uncharacterized protein DUF3570